MALLSFAMELKQLQQVVAVCDTGSFSGAAKALRVSQPTLSKSIARLERTLKIRLFDRSGGSARPTDYGQLVAERGEKLLSGVADLTRQIEQLGKGQAGRLRIGVGPATRFKLLPEVIRQISLSFPGLQLQARHDDISALVRALRVGRLDLVFCSFEGANEWGDLIRTKVCEDRRIAVVQPGLPGRDGKRRHAGRLRRAVGLCRHASRRGDQVEVDRGPRRRQGRVSQPVRVLS